MLATADKKASSRGPRQLNELARRHRRAHHQPDRLLQGLDKCMLSILDGGSERRPMLLACCLLAGHLGPLRDGATVKQASTIPVRLVEPIFARQLLFFGILRRQVSCFGHQIPFGFVLQTMAS